MAQAQKQTNQVAASDDDFYDAATEGFPSVEHLAPSLPPNFGPGRLVAIWARENGMAKSRTDGKPYPYTETVTLALDDGPNGDQHNDMVGPAPFRVDMRHSTGYIHGRLKGRVTGKNQKGVPMRHRPYIGRINTQVSNASKNQAAFGIEAPTAADLAIAEQYRDLIISINREMEEADRTEANEEAFS